MCFDTEGVKFFSFVVITQIPSLRSSHNFDIVKKYKFCGVFCITDSTPKISFLKWYCSSGF